jgi:hypothetical protein
MILETLQYLTEDNSQKAKKAKNLGRKVANRIRKKATRRVNLQLNNYGNQGQKGRDMSSIMCL